MIVNVAKLKPFNLRAVLERKEVVFVEPFSTIDIKKYTRYTLLGVILREKRLHFHNQDTMLEATTDFDGKEFGTFTRHILRYMAMAPEPVTLPDNVDARIIKALLRHDEKINAILYVRSVTNCALGIKETKDMLEQWWEENKDKTF